MSVDLEWGKLDSSLASSLVEALNRQLANTTRPSFIGPVEVSSLDFGSVAPEVELVDLRDIYRDFLEDDEDEDAEGEPVKATEGVEDEEGYEWVSRKAARAQSLPEEVPAYHLLPPHMRYGRGRAQDMFASTPSLHRDIWSPPMLNLMELKPAYPYASGYVSSLSRSMSATAIRSSFANNIPLRGQNISPSSEAKDESVPDDAPSEKPAPPTHPNLQVHLHIAWHSNLRLTFTTSLLINYPSPMFMSLPIKLSVTGLLFDGEVAVAYEGERRRIHLCVLDDLDPYCPLGGDRPKRDTPPAGAGLSPDHDDDTPSSSLPTRPSKPLPIGLRLLPNIYIESEIGQADKHVLKNVTRVERFIQDVIRKTVEEELVFPNFHTLVLPDPE